MLQTRIYNYFFSVIFILFCNAVHAQNHTDSLHLKTDSVKTKNTPHHLYVGIDVAKLAVNIFDKNKTRIEAIAETELKNNNWLSAEVAYANARFSNTAISYNNNSYAMVFGIGKSFFRKEFSTDVDNGFAGINIGTARTYNSKADYTITDIWGTSTGTTPAVAHQSYWLELSSGIRFQIVKKVVIGWRIKGKILLNQNAFKTTQPIYIASYGQGDKQALFGYNLFITYKLY